jgi:hypothetical protein
VPGSWIVDFERSQAPAWVFEAVILPEEILQEVAITQETRGFKMNKRIVRTCWLALLVAACVSGANPLFAQEDDGLEPVPLVPPKDVDLNGTWNYRSSQPKVSGTCPPGKALAGTVEITQTGNEVTFKYTSGTKCRPAAVCSYTGFLEYKKDNTEFVVANSVKVDEEGGEVSGAIHLNIFSNENGAGSGTSHYVHPKGFECRWDSQITIFRQLEE